jgi:DNA-binding transcriptional LysR family regulator
MARQTPNWDSRLARRVKLRDLHLLLAVFQSGSIAKGAAHLGLSQPSVSEAIASLEDALQVRLLDRSTRGVEPTIYGRALLKRANVVFDELKQGIRDIEFLSDPAAGEVRIGCPESLAAGFIPAVIEQLSRHHPKISVQVLAAQTGEQEFRELRERRVDLLLGRLFKPLSDDDVAMEYLCLDTFFVVASARSPWARRRRVALTELVNEPWILFPEDSVSGSYIEEAFRAGGSELPPRAVTSFSMQLRFHLLATGRFLTILHGTVLRFNAKRWSLAPVRAGLPVQPMPIAVFTLKNRTLSPVVQLLIEQAREIARSMPPVDDV